jgi:hypothetical protein
MHNGEYDGDDARHRETKLLSLGVDGDQDNGHNDADASQHEQTITHLPDRGVDLVLHKVPNRQKWLSRAGNIS